jgi:hypothetical protein
MLSQSLPMCTPFPVYKGLSRLLLIRLIQEATISSMRGCRVRLSRPASDSSNDSSLMRRPAVITLKHVDGRRASDVLVVATDEVTHCAIGSVGSAPSVGTKCH